MRRPGALLLSCKLTSRTVGHLRMQSDLPDGRQAGTRMCGVPGREEARTALLSAFDTYMRYAFPKVRASAMRWPLHADVHAAAKPLLRRCIVQDDLPDGEAEADVTSCSKSVTPCELQQRLSSQALMPGCPGFGGRMSCGPSAAAGITRRAAWRSPSLMLWTPCWCAHTRLALLCREGVSGHGPAGAACACFQSRWMFKAPQVQWDSHCWRTA